MANISVLEHQYGSVTSYENTLDKGMHDGSSIGVYDTKRRCKYSYGLFVVVYYTSGAAFGTGLSIQLSYSNPVIITICKVIF